MEEQKISKIMLYRESQIFWGDLVLNANISPIHFIHNSQNLNFISLENARSINFKKDGPLKPISYTELHIPVQKLLAVHFLPPNIEKYDTSSDVEKSNNFQIDITVGDFIFRGSLIFSNQLTLIQYIKRQSSNFLTLSDVRIIHQTRKDFNKIATPYAFVSISEAIVGLR
jgi:hypothetical protein